MESAWFSTGRAFCGPMSKFLFFFGCNIFKNRREFNKWQNNQLGHEWMGEWIMQLIQFCKQITVKCSKSWFSSRYLPCIRSWSLRCNFQYGTQANVQRSLSVVKCCHSQLKNKSYYHFIGWEPTTWPVKNCLQIVISSCIVLSRCVCCK